MKKYLWVVYPIFTIMFLISSIHKVNVARERTIEKLDKDYKESKKVVKSGKNVEFDDSLILPSREEIEREKKYQPLGIVEEEPIVEEVQEVPSSYTTRMTSFYPAESSDCTGSGKCTWDFEVNDKGWYGAPRVHIDK